MNNEIKPLIVYFGNYDLISKNASGNRVLNFTTILAKKYRIVNIFYTKNKNIEKGKLLKHDDLEIIPFDYPKNIFGWFKFPTLFKNMKNSLYNNNIPFNKIKFFIFYGSLFVSFQTLILLLVLKKYGIKIFFDVTEFDSSNKKNILFRFLRNVDYFFSEKIFPQFSDGIIVISKRMFNYFRHKNIILIPPLTNFPKNKFFPLNNNIKLVFAGTLGELKTKNLNKDRIDIILKLMKNFPQVQLDIYGFSKSEFLDSFPNFLISDNVHFFGFIDHKSLINLLRFYDFSIIFRLPSDKNNFGFPTKFAESFSSRLPVISTLFSDIPEYLIDGFNGFFIPYELIDATKKINYIFSLTREDLWNLKKNIPEESPFDLKFYASALLDFFQKIHL
jgi:glycosyltransferase involved in cell wall biosynthesis